MCLAPTYPAREPRHVEMIVFAREIARSEPLLGPFERRGGTLGRASLPRTERRRRGSLFPRARNSICLPPIRYPSSPRPSGSSLNSNAHTLSVFLLCREKNALRRDPGAYYRRSRGRERVAGRASDPRERRARSQRSFLRAGPLVAPEIVPSGSRT